MFPHIRDWPAQLLLHFFSVFLVFWFLPLVPDTLSQSMIGKEVSSSRLNYTGEPRNSSNAEAAWTRRKNMAM